ncbi:hypothetical protein ASG31_04075 [Chryseobacterium sp. Leaf404]|uniref:hypothetical protein n=1 Tax=unclassified Chryseobacterium TaxID=2593645 RepID=UPI000700D1DC|nr:MULTISPECIES: hypothetical protein [unclassified Chryseobacterium]KQT17923.1 hypothetical protein ASG31_04075 [Chryseobacterium sp. Leaf404]
MQAADDQIKKVGFYIKPLPEFIALNNHSRLFVKHQYFGIIISAEDFILKTDVGERAVKAKSVIYIGPGKTFQLLGNVSERSSCIVFRSCFYEKTPQDSFSSTQKFSTIPNQIFLWFPFAKTAFLKTNLLQKGSMFLKRKNQACTFLPLIIS